METCSFEHFEKLDIRTGTIVAAEHFPEARKPAYRLKVDFGEMGILQSSAQLTIRYRKEDLLQKQVIAVVNFPVKSIAGFQSQCLVLGVLGDGGDVVLLSTDAPVPNGCRIA